ncbi:MAG: putative N-acetyltransferase YafP [Pseudomonas citronellolis]|nr:MAG: putative N-acetyltransferase YafP [Pseudomonas citronellolis]
MPLTLRRATADDAPAISAVILRSLRQSNARDYPPAVIERVERNFDAEAVQALIARREVFVALEAEQLVGTASLDGAVVRSVFVDPDWQGRGIGAQLMAAVEARAREAGIERLKVPASLTAQAFYARQGYRVVREVVEGEERTIVMERAL